MQETIITYNGVSTEKDFGDNLSAEVLTSFDRDVMTIVITDGDGFHSVCFEIDELKKLIAIHDLCKGR